MRSKKNVIGVYGVTGSVFCGIAIFLSYHALFTSNIPRYWAAGLSFLLCISEVFSEAIVDRKITTANARQMITLYMLLIGIRLVIFATVICVYMLAIKIDTQRFVLVAAAIYCIYLLVSTLFLIKTEKRAKNEV